MVRIAVASLIFMVLQIAPLHAQFYWSARGDNVACRSVEVWRSLGQFAKSKQWNAMQRSIDSCPKLSAPQAVKFTGRAFSAPHDEDHWVVRRLIEVEAREGMFWVDPETVIGIPGDEDTRAFEKGDVLTAWDKVAFACHRASSWKAFHKFVFTRNVDRRKKLHWKWIDEACNWDLSRGRIETLVATGKKLTLRNPKGFLPRQMVAIEVEISKVRPHSIFKVGSKRWVLAYSLVRKPDAKLDQ